jgi:hypothetical protein
VRPLDLGQGVERLEVLLVDRLLAGAHLADPQDGEEVGREDHQDEQADDGPDLDADRAVREPAASLARGGTGRDGHWCS